MEGQQNEEALDQMIDAMGQMKKEDAGPEKSFEEKLADIEKHPAFMKSFDPEEPMTAEMEGLMKLRYECEDPIAKVTAYKDDGNHEFQKKKYKIAADNYTAGIMCKCSDLTLNAILYTNRAAAQSHIGNFRSAFNDCIFARKFKNDHMKAIHRGALCCVEMKKYPMAVKWCDEGLAIDPKDKKLLEVRQKAEKLQKAVERDERKEQSKEMKAMEDDMRVLNAIKDRNIKMTKRLSQPEGKPESFLTSLELRSRKDTVQVTMDTNNVMYWPVMFLYPEYKDTDYIQVFSEHHRFIDHLDHVFGVEADPAPWDEERKYKPHKINVYFEDKIRNTLHKVNKESILLKVLQHKRYCVYEGTPTFILMVAGSPYEKKFLEDYTVV